MKEKYIVIDIETTGLLPCYSNQITCFAGKTHEGLSMVCSGEDEAKLLKSIFKWLIEFSPKEYMFITKNGKQFDIPFIIIRNYIINGIKSNNFILNFDHYDLHELTNRWVSLEDMAKVLGFPENERKIGNGKVAIELFHAKRFEELEKYCLRDVELTEKVYKKIMELRKND